MNLSSKEICRSDKFFNMIAKRSSSSGFSIFNKIKFFVPNKLTHYRASTILNKEPETIEWIENVEKKNNEKIRKKLFIAVWF